MQYSYYRWSFLSAKAEEAPIPDEEMGSFMIDETLEIIGGDRIRCKICNKIAFVQNRINHADYCPKQGQSISTWVR